MQMFGGKDSPGVFAVISESAIDKNACPNVSRKIDPRTKHIQSYLQLVPIRPLGAPILSPYLVVFGQWQPFSLICCLRHG